MRKALIIGINDYNCIPGLNWCENDAMGVKLALERHANGDPNFASLLYTTNNKIELTKEFLLEKIEDLFKGNPDVALLYFAGHGGFEETMSEGFLCAQDFSPTKRLDGIRISDILEFANNSQAKNKIIILDSCNSGVAAANKDLKANASVIGDGVTILAACTKEESAEENDDDQHGLFTGLLLEGLLGGAVSILGQVTPGSLYSFIDNTLNEWEQRPVFKTNVSTFISLRDNAPLVDKSILRKLPELFESDSDIFKLDPSFEPDRNNVPEEYKHIPVNRENVEIFQMLQKCNRYGLVVPHDAQHMYYAAINSTGCKLTALGAYYRKLCLKGKV